MRRNILRHLLLLLIIAHLPIGLWADSTPSFLIERVGADKGFPVITARNMMQSQKGHIWMACSDGIVKYNGYEFEWFSSLPDGQHRRFDKIVEDVSQNIWTISTSQELFLINPSSGKFKCILDDKFRIRNVYALKGGTICAVSGKNQLYFLNQSSSGEWQIVEDYKTESNIKAIFQDQLGTVWVITLNKVYCMPAGTMDLEPYRTDLLGSFVFHGSYMEDEHHIYIGASQGQYLIYDKTSEEFTCKSLGTDASVISLLKMPDDEMVVVTITGGVYLLDSIGNIKHSRSFEEIMPRKSYDIVTCFKDSKNRIWLGRREGVDVFCYDMSADELHKYNFEHENEVVGFNRTVCFYETSDNIVWCRWLNSLTGYFDESTATIKSPFIGSDIAPAVTKSLLIDNNGGVWLGNDNYTLDYINSFKNPLKAYNSEEVGVLAKSAAMMKDRHGNLFVGSESGTLAVYDEDLNHITNIKLFGDKHATSSKHSYRVNHIYEDAQGYIWLSTQGGGLVCLHSVGEKEWQIYGSYNKRNNKAPTDYFSSVSQAPNGDLWLGMRSDGIYRIKSFTRERLDLDLKITCRDVFPEKQWLNLTHLCFAKNGSLWFGTTHGLVQYVNPGAPLSEMEFKMYDNKNSGLCGNDIRAIVEHPEYGIVVATYLNGIAYLDIDEDNMFISCSIPNMRHSFTIQAMTINSLGDIWGTTNSQIFCYSPEKNECVFFLSDRSSGNARYTSRQVVTDRDGGLYLGTAYGFLYGPCDSLVRRSESTRITLDKLSIHGDMLSQGQHKYLPQALDDMTQLVLAKKDNSFEIYFNTDNYIQPEFIQYKARLKGYDRDWLYIGNRHFVNYSNLPKGDYVLEIISTDSHGSWEENVRTLPITVLPSFWESTWGVLLIVLMIIASFLLSMAIIIRYIKMRDSIAFEHQLAEMKTQYMVDLVHEMRTPFTLIQGPVNQILQSEIKGGLSNHNRKRLEMVSRNINNMMHIINTLLDWQKLKKLHTRLTVRHFDLSMFMADVASRFGEMALDRGIALETDMPREAVMVWADPSKVERILLNLVSNAFKYTSEGKAITLSLYQREEKIVLQVKDEGSGISENFIAHIFEAFESSPQPNIFNQPSTGLGLSLVNELVKMHHGTITCESQLKQGTTFTVTLLAGKKHFLTDNNIEFSEQPFGQTEEEVTVCASTIEKYEVEQWVANDKRVRLLVVDDNPEILQFVADIFDDFCVFTASNGEEGLNSALINQPDLIISDIVMPVMDGVSMLKRLRENIQTSHIPVVLLTTKSSVEEQVSGWALDIDDYVTKPFSNVLLRQRISNLLERRKRLQAYYCLSIPKLDSADLDESDGEYYANASGLSVKEQRFLKKISEYIRQNAGMDKLNVEELANQMAMSRSVLSRKLKALTGLSPVDYIKSIRLQLATEYFDTTDMNISEVSYTIGFSHPHYFSRCFKQIYKITPTEYVKRRQQQMQAG